MRERGQGRGVKERRGEGANKTALVVSNLVILQIHSSVLLRCQSQIAVGVHGARCQSLSLPSRTKWWHHRRACSQQNRLYACASLQYWSLLSHTSDTVWWASIRTTGRNGNRYYLYFLGIKWSQLLYTDNIIETLQCMYMFNWKWAPT